MTSSEPLPGAEVDIATLLEGYRTKKYTAVDVIQSYLDRVEALDRNGPKINSIITVSDAALARAAELDAYLESTGNLVGPLHGVPMVLKDNMDTRDMPTTHGSETMAGFMPGRDATAVERLRDAGAILFAKTTLSEWTMSWFSYASISGTTKNPCALDHDTGASSAGTGAAVSADLAVAGLGTDCGGSVRLPSSFCNLVGFRSTPGVVPRDGTGPLLAVQDTVGPMTKTVADNAIILDVIKGYTPKDPASVAARIAGGYGSFVDHVDPAGLNGKRLGFLTSALGPDSNPDSKAVNTVIRGAVAAVEAAGATVVEVQIDDLSAKIAATSFYLDESLRDINAFLAEYENSPVKELTEVTAAGRHHQNLGLLLDVVKASNTPEDDPDYLLRAYRRHDMAKELLNLFGAFELDALIYPSCQVPAPATATMGDIVILEFPTNTVIASQALLPAISVPAGFTEDGLPVGLEFVGLPYADVKLMGLAAGFENATHARRPARLENAGA